MMAGSVPGSKDGVDTHKLWKHVLSWSTEFASVPSELAEAFCLPGLQLDPKNIYKRQNDHGDPTTHWSMVHSGDA